VALGWDLNSCMQVIQRVLFGLVGLLLVRLYTHGLLDLLFLGSSSAEELLLLEDVKATEFKWRHRLVSLFGRLQGGGLQHQAA